MRNVLLIALFASIFFGGCSYEAPPAIKVEATKKHIDYLADVKPILDKRCVTCHSCYNSPCQLKLSSFEGADRGATKELVYKVERFSAQAPTRLFIDANSTEAWRNKGFYSVTENSAGKGFNDSTMAHLLRQKMINPISEGEYRPELDELMCAKNGEEVAEFIDEHPNRGMPYGFPALTKVEYATVLAWLQQGAHGPTPEQQKVLITPSEGAAVAIKKWEGFLNGSDAKHQVTARYLYEHLFLAHLHFPEAPKEFYEVVRSSTPSPQPINVIATVRPFDAPGVNKFYYRIRKIHSTIVHKTHIVFELDDLQYDNVQQLFIESEWIGTPHVMDYDEVRSANPFLTFAQIPPRSRYQFMLNNSEYITRTFIRGPVCKGQIALNVIHDHFWIMFIDPDHDLSIKDPQFIVDESFNLSMPIEKGSAMGIFSTFSDRYRERYGQYIYAKGRLYKKADQAFGIDNIWKGNVASDAPMLTIYRHYDSASVLKGAFGQLPRTMWVMDYPQFERLYYALVAGFDVFGNLSHQTNVRRYMDFLRMEGELNFVAFLPDDSRFEMLQSWYIDDEAFADIKKHRVHVQSNIKYHTKDVKREFVEMVVNEHLLKETNITFDHNYLQAGELPPKHLPLHYKSNEDYIHALHVISQPGTAFMKLINGANSNLALLHVVKEDGNDSVFSIIINRWHDNVNSLFGEEDRLNPRKDRADFIEGSLGSYPNFFFVVKEKDLPDFFDLMENYEDTPEYIAKLLHYGVARNRLDFWEHYDWFQENFNKKAPIQAGMYDLNRYYYRAWGNNLD